MRQVGALPKRPVGYYLPAADIGLRTPRVYTISRHAGLQPDQHPTLAVRASSMPAP
jgi:hypothetical protein